MKKKECVITIKEDGDVDVQTNDVSKLEVLDALQAIMKVLSQELVQEAIKQVGNDDKAIERWIDLQRQNSKLS